MKLLGDMNLSPRWVSLLAGAGIEAAHGSTLGAKNAADSEIMAYGGANGYVVLTDAGRDYLQIAENGNSNRNVGGTYRFFVALDSFVDIVPLSV